MQVPRWAVPAEAFGVRMWGDGHGRLTDPAWAVASASERDLPSNHLGESRACGRIITSIPVRGVTFPLMHWSETSSDVRRRVGERERQERHEVGLQRAINLSLFFSLYLLTSSAECYILIGKKMTCHLPLNFLTEDEKNLIKYLNCCCDVTQKSESC